jgi:hypothetical protein
MAYNHTEFDDYKQMFELSGQNYPSSDYVTVTDTDGGAAPGAAGGYISNPNITPSNAHPNDPAPSTTSVEHFRLNVLTGKYEPFKYNRMTGKFEPYRYIMKG